MRYFSRDEVEKIGRAGGRMWQREDGTAFRFLSNFWLYVEENDTAFTPHGLDGFWEAWITKWVSQQLDDNDLFLDVGANVGYYSMMAAKHGLDVIAFEPNPELAEFVIRGARLNRLPIIVESIALSNFSGETTLVVPNGHSGGASMMGGISDRIEQSDKRFNVQVEPLDYFNISNKNILIKIDAEGAEPDIWAGMQKFWKANNCTVFLEWEDSRFDTSAFAQSLFGDDNIVGMIDFAGDERRFDNYLQLAGMKGFHTIVVRKR